MPKNNVAYCFEGRAKGNGTPKGALLPHAAVTRLSVAKAATKRVRGTGSNITALICRPSTFLKILIVVESMLTLSETFKIK